MSGAAQAERDSPISLHVESVLRIAEKMQRIFRLPVPDAPGLFLVGGEIDAAAFGLHGSKGPAISATGAGLDLLQAARSCVCEGVEFLSQLAAVDHRRVSGTPGDIAHGLEHGALARLLAMLGCEATARAPRLQWTEGRSFPGGTAVLLPAALCYRNVPEPDVPVPRVKLGSGCGAGPTREAALLHGLLELVERDAVALWWLGGRAGRCLPLESDPVAELNGRLRRHASSRVSWLLDITTDLGVPCVAALSVNAEGRGLACGFAARLTYAEAARAAVLEMCQMEVGLYLLILKCRQRGESALGDTDRTYLRRAFGFDVRGCGLLFPSADVERGEQAAEIRTGEPLEGLSDRFESLGVEAFWADLTRSDLAIPAVRALAPGLQPYPSDLVTPRLERQIRRTGGGFGLRNAIELM